MLSLSQLVQYSPKRTWQGRGKIRYDAKKPVARAKSYTARMTARPIANGNTNLVRLDGDYMVRRAAFLVEKTSVNTPSYFSKYTLIKGTVECNLPMQ
jgi:hypothetical protein